MEERTGYICGVFDSLTGDMLDTLCWCREKCSRLVVGVLSDDLSYRLLNRPVECEYEKRTALLKLLPCVDEIIEVGWGNITREQSHAQLKYKVCFYAGEYGGRFASDKSFCEKNGIEFLPLPNQKIRLFGKSLEVLLENSLDRDIVLFGTGRYFDLYMEQFGTLYPPAYAIDNAKEKWGKQKNGVRIYGMEKLGENSEKIPLVIVCAKDHAPIARQLEDFGGIDYRTLCRNDEFAVCDEGAGIIEAEAAYMEEAHRLLMILLVEFDRVCRKHGLKYFLNDGSLIGAVRHHALIPWDDDADVSMYRDDYERLKELAPKEWEGGEFELVTPDKIGKNIFHDFMTRFIYKKEKIQTGIFAKSQKRLRNDLKDTMCLDVYVMDGRAEDRDIHERQASRIKALYGLAMGHREKINFGDYSSQRQFVRAAIRLLYFAGKMLPLKLIFLIFEETCKKYNKKNKDSNIVYESNAPLCCLPLRLEKRLLGGGTHLKVCGHDIMVPEKYTEYLEAHGYHNFMEYPPGNMRRPTHSPKSRGIMYTV